MPTLDRRVSVILGAEHATNAITDVLCQSKSKTQYSKREPTPPLRSKDVGAKKSMKDRTTKSELVAENEMLHAVLANVQNVLEDCKEVAEHGGGENSATTVRSLVSKRKASNRRQHGGRRRSADLELAEHVSKKPAVVPATVQSGTKGAKASRERPARKAKPTANEVIYSEQQTTEAQRKSYNKPHYMVFTRGPKPWPPSLVIQLLEPMRKAGSPHVKYTVENLIANQCVDIKYAQVMAVLLKYEKTSQIPKGWGGHGRKQLLTDEDLEQIVSRYSLAHGETINEKQLKAGVIDVVTKKKIALKQLVIEEEWVPSTTFMKQTYARLMTMKVAGRELGIVKKTWYRSEPRAIARKSLRARLSKVAVVLNCAYYPVDEIPSSYKRHAVDHILSGTKHYPVKAIHSGLYFNWDEVKFFVSNGVVSGQNVSQLGVVDWDGKRISQYSSDSSAQKFTEGFQFGFQGGIASMPAVQPFAIVLSVKADTLSYADFPGGLVCMPIEGFSLASATNPGDKAIGYVFFKRGDSPKDADGVSVHVRLEMELNKIVRLPFVDEVREAIFGTKPGGEVPASQTAFGVHDGHDQQQHATRRMLEEFAQRGMRVAKGNPSGTDVDNALDAGDIHRRMKAMVKKRDYTVLDDGELQKADRFRTQVTAWEKANKIHLPASVKKLLPQVLATFPCDVQGVFTREKILSSFAATGIRAHNGKPDVRVMLQIGRDYGPGEEDKAWSTVPKAVNAAYDSGGVNEQLYDLWGIAPDFNSKGEIYRRDADITNESRQRFKELGHEQQVKLRDASKADKDAAAALKESVITAKHTALKSLSDEVRVLVEAAHGNIGNATVDDFWKAKGPSLLAFVKVRMFSDSAGATAFKMKKGKLPQARGLDPANPKEKSLVYVAWSLRNAPELLLPPTISVASQAPPPAVPAADLSLHVRPLTSPDPELASKFLTDATWIKDARLLLIGIPDASGPISQSLLDKADALQRLVITRTTQHLGVVLKTAKQKQNGCWNFQHMNSGIIAALVTLAGHVHEFIATRKANQCLLAADTELFVGINELAPTRQPARPRPRLSSRRRAGAAAAAAVHDAIVGTHREYPHGSYLVDDKHGNKWGSGKGAGRHLVERVEEHGEKAGKGPEGSFPGEFFPTRAAYEANPAAYPNIIGFFENIRFAVAVAWWSNNNKGVAENIFVWPDGTLEQALRTGFKVKADGNVCQKEAHFIAYAAEYFYERCLAPANNVSNNPGWESVLGIFSSI